MHSLSIFFLDVEFLAFIFSTSVFVIFQSLVCIYLISNNITEGVGLLSFIDFSLTPVKFSLSLLNNLSFYLEHIIIYGVYSLLLNNALDLFASVLASFNHLLAINAHEHILPSHPFAF